MQIDLARFAQSNSKSSFLTWYLLYYNVEKIHKLKLGVLKLYMHNNNNNQQDK